MPGVKNRIPSGKLVGKINCLVTPKDLMKERSFLNNLAVSGSSSASSLSSFQFNALLFAPLASQVLFCIDTIFLLNKVF